jgi:hypothetical protein
VADDDPVVARLEEALRGSRCVSAWLGYGEVLFAGFGSEVLPEREPDGRRTRPPYKLHTNFADWWIEENGRAAHDETRASAERAAKGLVGRPSWRGVPCPR